MGSFSYMCNGCKANIRCGEKAVLIHIREGKQVGRAQGTYDDYGRILEDPVFRKEQDGINSHEAMCESEFEMQDSGIEAWHLACYEKASPEDKDAHHVSPLDPMQGEGEAREEFK